MEQGNALITGSGTSDLQAALLGDTTGFPFKTEFSLEPLIDFWLRSTGDASSTCASLSRLVAEQIGGAPELRAPITDPSVLDRHEDLVDVLMSAEIAPALWEQSYTAAMIPFQLRGFYATPAMRRDLMHPDGRLKG